MLQHICHLLGTDRELRFEGGCPLSLGQVLQLLEQCCWTKQTKQLLVWAFVDMEWSAGTVVGSCIVGCCCLKLLLLLCPPTLRRAVTSSSAGRDPAPARIARTASLSRTNLIYRVQAGHDLSSTAQQKRGEAESDARQRVCWGWADVFKGEGGLQLWLLTAMDSGWCL
jgi:hypothetical protein